MNKVVISLFDIDPFRIGGTEAFAHELSAQLLEHGWKSILCFKNEPPAPVQAFLKLPNVTLEVLRNPSSLSWRTLREYMKIIRRHRPSILHLQYTPLVSPLPWLARLLLVKKIFFTDHWSRPAGHSMERPAAWKRIAGRVALYPYSGVVGVSDYVCQCLSATGMLRPQQIHRIYDSVDTVAQADATAGENFRRKWGIPLDRLLVVQVSQVIPQKGWSDLLEAARLVLQRSPDVYFAMVGEGAYRKHFMDEASALGLATQVIWTGLSQNPIADGVYSAADVVCQPSRWKEAFGWTIAEAMLCERPVIATRVGGIPELIQDGETGLLVPPSAPAALAGNILSLLENRSLREKMGHAARRIVEKKFSVRTNITKLLDLYGVN
jgi:glycosyltransferase involved in cell wall biosynthesis